MRRFLGTLIILVVVGPALSTLWAQGQPAQGDPPVASLIAISAPDADGIVTITGSAGAVFPGAQVAIRNLYTEQVVYTPAGITGTFTAHIYGPGNTPFWISPATSIPASARNRPGSLPGGPGTIIYGAFPDTRQTGAPVTQLVIDGSIGDWIGYPQSGENGIYALRNRESLYLAVNGDLPPDYAQLRLTFTLDGVTYILSLDPRLQQPATLTRVTPDPADMGTLAVANIQVGSTIEARVPLSSMDPAIEAATLNRLQFVDASDNELAVDQLDRSLPLVDEVDGIVYPEPRLADQEDVARFSVSGPLAQGASTWTARGRVDRLSHQPGSRLLLEMDVTMNVPELPGALVGLRMIGQVGLQPVIGADGMQAAGGLDSNNGWSSLLTPSGLAVDNLRGDFTLGETVTEPQQVIRRGDQLTFGLRFVLTLPSDLPPGLYVPIFHGLGQVGDGDPFAWEDNGLFGTGPGISRVPLTRLPVVLNVGETPVNRLAWALFYDQPSDGSRGVLAEEDRAAVALSNRVRFNSPTYILPPGTYPIEPYLLNQLPNAYDTTSAPLIPLLIPGGRLSAEVTRPDGTIEDLGTNSIAQSWLSTAALDERTVFGAHVPVDVYRLTTLNPMFTAFSFDQYGSYRIALTGNVDDVWGNRYQGGGTYTLLIAEMLDLTPGVLPGTPFEVGDMLNPGLRLSPGVPADVTVTVRIYPLDGSPEVDRVFKGQADRYGYFRGGGESFRFDMPGEYIIDYEARHTTPDGQLWAASLRSAGVIAKPQGMLIAHGRRGLDRYYPELRPAWFTTKEYPPDADAAPVLNYPYQAGDVAWVADTPEDGVRPIIQVEDTGGAYASWLAGTLPDYTALGGQSIDRLAVVGELPLLSVLGGPPSLYSPVLLPDLTVSQAYAYISAVRPGVTVRQFVQGSDDDSLSTAWDADDPHNGQIGAGTGGDRPGDYTFLFGGAVIRNAEAGIEDTAIYAALAVTTSADATLGSRVFPPYLGETGGPNGGPLFTVGGEDVEMLFYPTGTQPGQTMSRGDTLVIAGHVGPPLASQVAVTVTSPSGVENHFEGRASSVGYFYNPADDFTVNEIGVWQVDITVTHDGLTSAGQAEAPFPAGHLRFPVYVLPPDAVPLQWEQGGNIDRPTRAGSPINFVLSLPDGWTNVQVYYTATMPGYVLSSGTLQPFGRSASYQYSPATLSRDFPSLESDGRSSGPAASDVVTITFAITGLDANGTFQVRSRTFTIMNDRLLSLETGGGE